MAFKEPLIIEGVEGLHGVGARAEGGGVLLKPGNDVELVTEAVKGMLRGEVASDKEVRCVMRAISSAVGRTGCVQIEGMVIDPGEHFYEISLSNSWGRKNPRPWHAHLFSPDNQRPLSDFSALYTDGGSRFVGPPTYVAPSEQVRRTLQRRARIGSFEPDSRANIAEALRMISILQERAIDGGAMIDQVAADQEVDAIKIDWREKLLAIFSDRSMVHARPQWRGDARDLSGDLCVNVTVSG